MNPEKITFTSPEQEIAFLREQISKKEMELREKKSDYNLEEVVRGEIQKYKDVLPKDVLDETYALAKVDAESIILNLEPETHDKKMEELLGILNEKGIRNVLSILSNMKDPHLEDDFHRLLVQYIAKGYPAKGVDTLNEEFRGLGMTLFEVVLPEENKKEDEKEKAKPLKEMISSMEQFLAGMLSVAPKGGRKEYKKGYIVLEIANSNGSDQFVFYVAVPNKFKDLFQKQIISVFSEARITEAVSDYNIFNTDGVSVGSYLQSTENPIYPLKTYESFDYDPMNVILNTFSKLQKNGEGAAIQIVFSPRGNYYQKKYKYAVEEIERGVKLKDAIYIPESFVGEMKKTIKSIVKSLPKENEVKKPVDSDAVQRIKTKMSTTVVSTNIRLLVSAHNRSDAERILETIESSFNQFTDSVSTGLKPKRLEKGKLQRFFRDFSFRAYNADQTLPLNIHEITSMYHFQNTGLAPTPQLKQTMAITAPAPAGIKDDGNYLGVNNFRNTDTPIYISDEDRLRHMYVIGQTGAGKTVFLKNQIIQDIKNGKGCCFIDPHGSDVQDVLANVPQDRYQDVIYFDPAYSERPFALNMLEYDYSKPDQKIFVVNELFGIFKKLFAEGNPESMGPAFEQYFRNACMLVMEHPESGNTLVDISRVLSNKKYRDMKLSHCKNPIVIQFWENAEKTTGDQGIANYVPYITNKFDVFLANDIMRPIISQEKSSFNFREIMDNKKILLVNLSKGKLGEMNANLIGLILVGKIQMAALSRVDVAGGDFPPFYLYIDEFQNITTDSISSIFSEARKYKLSLSVAHQYIAQLEEGIRDSVFGNVGNIISFRISADDAEYMEKIFSPVFTAKDMMNLENLNAYVKILIKGIPQKGFNVKEEYPPRGNPAVLETLKQLSYLTYGADREEVEEHIQSKFKI